MPCVRDRVQYVKPVLDVLRCAYNGQLAVGGRYHDALARMECIDPNILRVLKHQQYWGTCMGLLKLQRALHRS